MLFIGKDESKKYRDEILYFLLISRSRNLSRIDMCWNETRNIWDFVERTTSCMYRQYSFDFYTSKGSQGWLGLTIGHTLTEPQAKRGIKNYCTFTFLVSKESVNLKGGKKIKYSTTAKWGWQNILLIMILLKLNITYF